MPMSKGNYKAIAECINNSFDPINRGYLYTDVLIHLLSDYFGVDNPNFSMQKFKDACLWQETGE